MDQTIPPSPFPLQTSIKGPAVPVPYPANPVIVLSGAGGRPVDPAMFASEDDDKACFETLTYPGWREYVQHGFTADKLVAQLVNQMIARVPVGPIHIIGVSLGGHFGYAAALRLQELGHPVGSFCSVDTYMTASAAPGDGWGKRALQSAAKLLRNLRFGEFIQFLRSRFWRALLRLSMQYLPALLRRYSETGRQPQLFKFDPLLEEELSMRLLIQHSIPFVASLNSKNRPLHVQAVMFRTAIAHEDDAAWLRRCPEMKIIQIPHDHESMFEPAGMSTIRKEYATAKREWQVQLSP